MTKTKLYITKSDGSYQVFESSCPLEEAVAQWQWYHDPLNMMPLLSIFTFLVVMPLFIIVVLLAIVLYLLKYLNNLIGFIANYLNNTWNTMTDNHTRLSIKQ
jgi:uncharacterized membrane protein